MINLKHNEFQAFLRHTGPGNPALMRELTSMALGMAVCLGLPIPSQSGENLSGTFDQTLLVTAMTVINDFNEGTPVDMDLALSTCRSYWQIRYRIAHPDPHVLFLPMGNNSFFEKIGYVNDCFSAGEVEKITANGTLLVTMLNRVLTMIRPEAQG